VAHDPLRADPALAHLARAGHDEGRARRRAGHGVAEGVEAGLARRVRHRRDVRPRDRILAVHVQLPLGQERLIAGIERVEPVEAEGRRAPELDGAERRAGSALGAKVAIDEPEAVAPGDRGSKRGMHDLVAGRRDDA
jgi:hypothetical protein